MLLPHLLAFCRVVIGLVFAISFASKAADIPLFVRTITQFGILHRSLSKPAALVFLAGEGAVVLLVVVGGRLLVLGFALAVFLLLVFCIALVSVLRRKIHTSCNCFGPSEKSVSFYDVWRNVGFTLCAVGGWMTLGAAQKGEGSIGAPGWILAGFAAVVFVAIWTQVGEFAQLLRQN